MDYEKLANWAAITFAWSVVAFFMLAFVAGNINPFSWHIIGRIAMVIIWLGICLVVFNHVD